MAPHLSRLTTRVTSLTRWKNNGPSSLTNLLTSLRTRLWVVRQSFISLRPACGLSHSGILARKDLAIGDSRPLSDFLAGRSPSLGPFSGSLIASRELDDRR